MAGVGEEAPGEFLAGLALLDGGLDPGEHPVECGPEAANLGAGIVRADPVGEVTGGDAVGLAGHHLDGPQAAAHDPGDAQADEQGGGQRADGDDELEPADGPVDIAEAGGDDEDAVVGAHGLQAERSVAGADHRLRAMASGQDGQIVREPGPEVGVAAHRHPRRMAAHENYEVLPEEERQQQARPGDHNPLLD